MSKIQIRGCVLFQFFVALYSIKCETAEELQLQSPKLDRLSNELRNGNRSALAEFWSAITNHAPLIEIISNDNTFGLVTFVWRSSADVPRILLSGGPPAREGKWLTRMPDTDLWFRTERIPRDSRFTYGFAIQLDRNAKGQDEVVADPLNPHTFDGRSFVELPDAPPQPWIERADGVAQGKITSCKIVSKFLNEEREIGVYTPAGYNPNAKRCNLLIVFDGPAYLELIPTPVILDNLIGRALIPPTIAIGIANLSDESRRLDLHCYEPFADFVSKELVPWVRRNYRVSSAPSKVVIPGSSAGGLTAAFCAFRAPQLFGNVLSQSGSFWYDPGQSDSVPEYLQERGWLTRQFAVSRRLPLRFYVESGRFEIPEQLADHRRLLDVLKAKGYPVIYREYNGGHDYFNWRGTIGDALIALMAEKR